MVSPFIPPLSIVIITLTHKEDTMQLAVIDNQIERIAALLAKYVYTDDEKATKLAYLRGYIAACLDADVISVKEYDAYTEIVNAL